MTVNKQFKDKVRARQHATGEPYTLARRHVLAELADPRLASLVDNHMWRVLAAQLESMVPDEPALTAAAAGAGITGRPRNARTWTQTAIAVAHAHRGSLVPAVVDELALVVPANWTEGVDPHLVVEARARTWEPASHRPTEPPLLRTTITLALQFNASAAMLHDDTPRPGVAVNLPWVTYPCEGCGEHDGVTMVDCDWPFGVADGDRVTGRGWLCSDRESCESVVRQRGRHN